MEIKLIEPFTKEKLAPLRAGDSVLISGTIYTARDAAHKRMVEGLEQGKDLPFPIKDALIYYVGPTPAHPGKAIGSAGPTTSYRMDAYAPTLLDLGQSGMIGKGPRNQEVNAAVKRNGAVYFAAIGGAGALISKSIVASEVIAFDELGAEAVRKLTVKDMPVIVAVDSEGNDLYRKEG
ncbi:MAG: Fe-S-containing hydro-lyase [Anaerovoracaceae bacterium]